MSKKAGYTPPKKYFAVSIFLITEILLLPITILGMIVFATILYSNLRGRNISNTAYMPIFSRWFMHELGVRENITARLLWFALPGVSRIGTRIAICPTVWAMRISGIAFYLYDFSKSSSLVAAFGHRTRFFDDAMLQYLDQMDQVVILGAGWDTRAYGFPRRESVRIYEIDEVRIQIQKRESLERANIDTTNVFFVSVDLNKDSWIDALNRSGFNPDKPTFLLMEGVTYYLEVDTVKEIFQTVATNLAKGSAIAFDYIGQHIVDGNRLRFLRSMVPRTGLTFEQWKFGINTEARAEERLAAFLKQNGLILSESEPIGKMDEKHRLDGGLVLAVNR